MKPGWMSSDSRNRVPTPPRFFIPQRAKLSSSGQGPRTKPWPWGLASLPSLHLRRSYWSVSYSISPTYPVDEYMLSLPVYAAAALAEIGGCFAFWAWLRLGRSALWVAPDRKSTRLKLQSLMRITYAVFCLKKKNQY